MNNCDQFFVDHWACYLRNELPSAPLRLEHLIANYKNATVMKLKGELTEAQEIVCELITNKLSELGYFTGEVLDTGPATSGYPEEQLSGSVRHSDAPQTEARSEALEESDPASHGGSN